MKFERTKITLATQISTQNLIPLHPKTLLLSNFINAIPSHDLLDPLISIHRHRPWRMPRTCTDGKSEMMIMTWCLPELFAILSANPMGRWWTRWMYENTQMFCYQKSFSSINDCLLLFFSFILGCDDNMMWCGRNEYWWALMEMKSSWKRRLWNSGRNCWIGNVEKQFVDNSLEFYDESDKSFSDFLKKKLEKAFQVKFQKFMRNLTLLKSFRWGNNYFKK